MLLLPHGAQSPLLDQVQSYAGWAALAVGIFGVIVMLGGVASACNGYGGAAAPKIISGTVLVIFAGVTAGLLKASGAAGKATDGPSKKAPSHPSTTPTPRPTHHPSGTTSPPWAWIGFGAATIVLVIVAIVFVAVLRHRIATARAAAQERAKLSGRWDAALSDLDDGLQQWLAYDKNLELLLAAPAMRDYQCATTIACVNAMSAAENMRVLRPARGTAPGEARKLVKEFEAATSDFTRTLSQAVRYATGAGLRRMSHSERRKLEQAQDALRLAQGGATEGERRNAYRLVTRLVGELDMELPAPAHEAIEAQIRQMIGAPNAPLAEGVSS